jgi:hypothetical protein
MVVEWKKEVRSASLARVSEVGRGTAETGSKQLKGDLGLTNSQKMIHMMVSLYVEGIPVTKGTIGVGKLLVVPFVF